MSIKSTYKPILSLDFDGTINSYKSGWKGPRNIPDSAMPGALQFIAEAQDLFTINIFSTRSHYFGGRRAMRNWLFNEYNKLFSNTDDLPKWFNDRINYCSMEPMYILIEDAIKDIIKKIGFPKHKPPALVTIDDRAIQFTGEWPDLDKLRNFKPYKLGD